MLFFKQTNKNKQTNKKTKSIHTHTHTHHARTHARTHTHTHTHTHSHNTYMNTQKAIFNLMSTDHINMEQAGCLRDVATAVDGVITAVPPVFAQSDS